MSTDEHRNRSAMLMRRARQSGFGLCLLAPEPEILGLGGGICAPGVDVDAAAPVVAGGHGQSVAAAAVENFDKHALDAGFMEVVVLAKRDDVLEQSLTINLRSAVLD